MTIDDIELVLCYVIAIEMLIVACLITVTMCREIATVTLDPELLKQMDSQVWV
jgi:hypothetical protein